MKPFDLNLDAMCKRLSLANTRRSWRDLVARAETEQWSYHDFLSTLIAEEVAHRTQTRIQRNSQRLPDGSPEWSEFPESIRSEFSEPTVRGDVRPEIAAHVAWIGIRYSIGTIRLEQSPPCSDDIELVAQQLAPLVERLLENEASERRSIREDIERVYERRIRDALIRYDGNASVVARKLSVSRGRVAKVARRLKRR